MTRQPMGQRLRCGFATLLALYASVLMLMAHTQAQAAEKYGKTLVAVIDLPQDAIAAYASFKPSPVNANAPAIENKLTGNSVEWRGDAIPTPSQGNPYLMVLKIGGEVIADGPVQSQWLFSWNRPTPNGDVRSAVAGFPAVEAQGKAGQYLRLVAVSNPTSFKEDLQTIPSVGFLGATNVKITSVQVELWTGLPGNSFKDIFRALAWLIFSGLIVLSGWWFFRRPR